MREMSFSDILLKELLVHLSVGGDSLGFAVSAQTTETFCAKSVEAETTLTWLSAHLSPRTFNSSRSVKSYSTIRSVRTYPRQQSRANLTTKNVIEPKSQNFGERTANTELQTENGISKPMDVIETLALDSVRKLGFDELDEGADFAFVKTQFRLFARMYHPDLVTTMPADIQKQRAEIFQHYKPCFDILLAWAAK